ncbi:hypothetical protein [Gordonia rhizosphera]|uniref:hypothetical protein n=1 Tax=Gordonia rhizosphera TaxID=83341 RepID=UPI0002E54CE9|nr:hypothetical protein [Gordonia rhizosphera]
MVRTYATATISSVAVWTLGFGVTAVAALLVDHGDLPGMWDYLGGTLGDGLLLPIIVFGLIRGLQRLGGRSLRPLSWLVATLSALGGLISQYMWLADPEPRLNWMLIDIGTFSKIGWYHCVFLIMISGLLAGLACEILFLARECGRSQAVATISGDGAGIVSACLAGFIAAIVSDSSPSLSTSSSVSTVGLLAAIPVGVIVAGILILRREVTMILPPLLVGVAIATISVVLIFSQISFSGVTVLGIIAVSLLGLAIPEYYRRGRNLLITPPVILTGISATYFLCLILSWPQMAAGYWKVFLVATVLNIGILIGLAAASRKVPSADRFYPLFVGSLFTLICGIAQVSTSVDKQVRSTLDIVVVVATVVATTAAANLGQAKWQEMVELERMTRMDGKISSELPQAQRSARIFAVPLLIAGVCAILAVTVQLKDGVTWSSGIPPSREEFVLLATAMSLVLLGSVYQIVRAMSYPKDFSRDSPPPRQPSSGFTIAISALTTTMSIVPLFVLALGVPYRGIWTILVTIGVLVLGIDTFETILINSTLMCRRWPTSLDVLTALCAAGSTSLALYWCLLGGWAPARVSPAWFILMLVSAIVLRYVVCLGTGSTIYNRGTRYFSTDGSVVLNQAADETTRMALLVLLGALPMLIIPCFSSFFVGLGIACVIALSVSSVYINACRRMLAHNREQIRVRFGGRYEVPATPEEGLTGILWQCGESIRRFCANRRSFARGEEKYAGEIVFVSALGAHLSFQVIIRVIFTFCTVVGVSILTIGVLSNRKFNPD